MDMLINYSYQLHGNMTKSINCGEIVDNCNWSATAENEEELMKKIKEHAKEHGYADIPEDLVVKVKNKIRDI